MFRIGELKTRVPSVPRRPDWMRCRAEPGNHRPAEETEGTVAVNAAITPTPRAATEVDPEIRTAC